MSSESKKIHVMHLIGSTGLFGAERWLLALMRGLDPDRVKSTLVNLIDGPEEKNESKNKNKKSSDVVEAARQRGFLFSEAFDFHTGGRLNPWAAVRLSRWARANKVQVIHGHGYKSDITGLVSARLAGCRVITTPHGWSLEKDRKLALYEGLDRASFRFMDKVCPLSPALAEDISRGRAAGSGYADKVRLIMNGVDVEELNGTQPAAITDTGQFRIGYIGQLIDRKDISTLLKAVKLLLDADLPAAIKVSLTVIGSGYRKEALEGQAASLGIAENVDFMGFRDDAARFLKTFHLFVLPSLCEGIPRCLMEAMAAGIPVVASGIEGNMQLVSDGETGLLFAPGDAPDLAGKLRYAIGHPGEAETMAKKAQQKIEREFSSRRMAREYAALYSELVLE